MEAGNNGEFDSASEPSESSPNASWRPTQRKSARGQARLHDGGQRKRDHKEQQEWAGRDVGPGNVDVDVSAGDEVRWETEMPCGRLFQGGRIDGARAALKVDPRKPGCRVVRREERGGSTRRVKRCETRPSRV